MNSQNKPPITASTLNRAPRPRSFAIVRARAVSHFGNRSSASAGSGRFSCGWTSIGRAPMGSASASGIKDLDQLARGILASETQEDLLESLRITGARGFGAQLGHRAARANLSFRDDRHTI